MRTQIPLTRVECDHCGADIKVPYHANQRKEISFYIRYFGWTVVENGLGEKDYCPEHAFVPPFVEAEEDLVAGDYVLYKCR